MANDDLLSAAALATERAINPGAAPLAGGESAARGKVLLTCDAQASFGVPPLDLQPVRSGEAWRRYEVLRVAVEAEFGLDASDARRLVERARQRGAALGMRMWFGCSDRQVVSAVGAFRLTGRLHRVARIQEVDVFPAYRGRGYGRRLLEALRIVLDEEGVRWLVMGADEEDWPLGWYTRLGFRPAVRVAKSA